MTGTLIGFGILIYVSWLVYEAYNAPLVDDDVCHKPKETSGDSDQKDDL